MVARASLDGPRKSRSRGANARMPSEAPGQGPGSNAWDAVWDRAGAGGEAAPEAPKSGARYRLNKCGGRAPGRGFL
jgi:hypothetical protein